MSVLLADGAGPTPEHETAVANAVDRLDVVSPAELGAVDKTENKPHNDDCPHGPEPHGVVLRLIYVAGEASVRAVPGVGGRADGVCGHPDVEANVGQTEAAEHQRSHAKRQDLHLRQWPRLEPAQDGPQTEGSNGPQEAAGQVGETAEHVVTPATSPHVLCPLLLCWWSRCYHRHRQRCWRSSRYHRHQQLLRRICWCSHTVLSSCSAV
mmetsp:Transcript_34461/g.85394  ORF Transcript_34461/g.85394 Transcript_34461/m.85394 type:complete len:209 (-) Transcript_34461:80-706(-)